MSTATDSKLYQLIKVGERYLLVSNSSFSILQFLAKHPEAYYDEIQEDTGIPQSSLYVFCQRLEEAGLIRREKKLIVRNNSRVNTLITLVEQPKFLPLDICR